MITHSVFGWSRRISSTGLTTDKSATENFDIVSPLLFHHISKQSPHFLQTHIIKCIILRAHLTHIVSYLLVERYLLVQVRLKIGLVWNFHALFDLILTLNGMLSEGKQILAILAFSSIQLRNGYYIGNIDEIL